MIELKSSGFMIGGSDVFLFSKNASVWAPMDGKWLSKYKAASSSNRVELAQAQVCALNPAACTACAFNLPCAVTAGVVIGGGYILWNETKETDKNDEGQRGISGTTTASPDPDDEGDKREIKINEKIKNQTEKRGWTEEEIKNTVKKPEQTKQVKDMRFNADGTRNNDTATAYIDRDGNYVIINNKTGDVVQISDKTKPNWKNPF